MKHIRPITVAKANVGFGSQLYEQFVADLFNVFIYYFLASIFGLPEDEPMSKET